VRYALLAFPPFILLLTAGLRGAETGWRRIVACALIAAIGLSSLRNYFFVERYARDDNRSAGGYLSARARAGDLVVATAGYTAQNLRYYYTGPAVTIAAYPAEDGGHAVLQGPGLAPVVVGARYVVSDAVPADLAELTAGHERIWLFASRTYHSDPAGLIAGWLDHRMCRRTVQRWAGVELRFYERPRPAGVCPAVEGRETTSVHDGVTSDRLEGGPSGGSTAAPGRRLR